MQPENLVLLSGADGSVFSWCSLLSSRCSSHPVFLPGPQMSITPRVPSWVPDVHHTPCSFLGPRCPSHLVFLPGPQISVTPRVPSWVPDFYHTPCSFLVPRCPSHPVFLPGPKMSITTHVPSWVVFCKVSSQMLGSSVKNPSAVGIHMLVEPPSSPFWWPWMLGSLVCFLADLVSD